MIREDVEILDETILDDEPACQMDHKNPENCTVTVTHRILGCVGQFLMCDFATHLKRETMSQGRHCAGCGRKQTDCWRVLPV